ncbi:peptide deformylase [Pelosinus baikalensis]|uniref:Peptide deformylase n=1 Tax=Pelosinus baikalensis TaxID=2892015 RepID=A0ABS8HXZ5_9FIRM|nr:peptide deformylase [Pelosinus baikalensis]MCC5468015.1 peptide deformylase [Pelosinus baikalensis]
MTIREVRQLGDVVLREISEEVKEIDEEILTLLKDMAETMYDAGGVGIAAPQVGELKRIVVIDVEKGQGLINLINPEIIETEESHEVTEGCLSIEHKKKRGKLLRPVKVTVKALNEKGEEFTMTGENLLAQAFCHEIDHLDGILIVDKVTEWLPKVEDKAEEDK